MLSTSLPPGPLVFLRRAHLEGRVAPVRVVPALDVVEDGAVDQLTKEVRSSNSHSSLAKKDSQRRCHRQRPYPPKFRAEAVRLVREGGRTTRYLLLGLQLQIMRIPEQSDQRFRTKAIIHSRAPITLSRRSSYSSSIG
jgi:hypothetical protein